jgi:phosphoglycolate phosphatase
VVVFDIDGTLLDSAPGIIAGFQHALRSVGFSPPDAETLRLDLGPPVEQIFTALGLASHDLGAAVLAYRAFYLAQGLQQSRPYDGVVALLERLSHSGVTMATATAKRTEVAQAIVDHHGLGHFFRVVNGTDDLHRTKTETLTHTLELLGHPAPDRVVMVGDRHSDVTAAVSCGVLPVAVTWGYGSSAELQDLGVTLVDHPRQLLDLPLLQPA